MISTVFFESRFTENLIPTVWLDDWFTENLIATVLVDGRFTETCCRPSGSITGSLKT